jgi:hypothetical protein
MKRIKNFLYTTFFFLYIYTSSISFYMFRPNTTTTATTPAADLNEFPVLGTPPPSMNNRLPNRLASYASTAGNIQDMDDFSKLGSFRNIQTDQRNLAAPRSFSMDEFPALRSAQSPFDSSIGRESGKPEQWLDYANLREQQGKL